MNTLHVGLKKHIDLPSGGYLYIHDEVPRVPRARILDVTKHSFNPLEGIDERKAREIADVLYAIYPQGENTLTVRNGRRDLLQALLGAKRLDKVHGSDEIDGVLADLLVSPVVRNVLCKPTSFSFNPRSVILVPLDRAKLGEFDALVIGLMLMAHYPGQLVIPDFGFYGREVHTGLLREERLIAGVNFLDELPEKLRKRVLLVPNKVASGALYDDAVELAKFEGLRRDTNEYNDFIAERVG